MSTPTQVTPVPVNIDQLWSKKGQLVTQIEIAQGQLQQINLQLQQILNTQAPPA